MKIFSISRWLKNYKENIVKNHYYRLHDKIFSINTIAELTKMYDVVDQFFALYTGYCDEELLNELCRALIKSVHVRSKILVAAQLKAV